MITAPDLALLTLSTARLSRLLTTDDAGAWYVSDPAREWAAQHDAGHPDGWRSRLVSGLECPFCVGFWLGVLNVSAYSLARRSPLLLNVWRLAASTLALNYVVGHVSAKID